MNVIKMNCLAVMLFFVIVFLYPFRVNADEGSNIFTLGEVEVAGRSDENRNISVDKIYDEEMRLLNKDKLSDAVNLVPGVTLSRSGGRNEATLYIRGLDIKHVPLFLDGIPIYVPYDGYPDLGRFYTFDLSQVVISKGFTSVLYGPNTMGGAINMVSKRPEKVFEGNMGAGIATGDTYNTYLNLGTNQGKWYMQAGLSYVDSSYFKLSKDYHKPIPSASDDGGKRDNSYQRDTKANIKVAYTPNKEDEYALSYINQHGVKGVPPYTGYDTGTFARYWRWAYWDKESLYFTSRTSLGSKSYVKTRLYYDTFENALNMYTDNTYTQLTGGSSHSWYDDYTLGGSIEIGTKLVPHNSLKAAFHLKRDVHREESNDSPLQRFRDDIYSFGLEDTIDITKKLYVIIGASYDMLDTRQAQDLTSTTPKTTVDFQQNDTHSFNPQIGIFYLVSDTGKVHAAVSKKTRIPSIKDRFSYKMGKAIPNPDLKPEKAVNYEVGYQDTYFKKIRFKTTVFYNDISDYILNVTMPGSQYQNQNVGKVENTGIEAELSGDLLSNLEGGISYTWIKSENKTNSDKLTGIPENKVTAYLKYAPVKPLNLLGSYEYNSSRYSSSNGVRTAGSFSVFNTKVIYEIAKGFSAEAGINNLFDKNYAIDEGYPEPGRTFFANMRYRF
ncbi:MAG: TonB-dependent receptor [Dissulfurispiraceae bacterium]|jgi:iron complex outermembrane receptor protein|nr:TonB-dependent receptor [Dissulfurispiraceae bacterium]